MKDLLNTVIEAHGGLERWNQLTSVSAHLVQGGALWGIKGQAAVLEDVVVTASLHEERVSHRPFGAAGRRSAFTPGRVAIQTDDGTVLEALDQPRDSFADHTFETTWSTLQLAYFVGTAMWTYLTTPFAFAMPGFHAEELTPWEEQGQTWRRLKVTYPPAIATHTAEQTFYFGDDGLLRRHDYTAEVVKAGPVVHYTTGHQKVDGIVVPAKHRVYPANVDGAADTELLIVSIDLDQITYA
jgi:hypothetical protein